MKRPTSDGWRPRASTRFPVLARGAAETLAWAGTVSYLLYETRKVFFLAQSSIGHDNLFWFYPVYQFLADSLLQGRFPYWDPFTHGGVAFYPVLLQLRLLEPISYVVLGVGSLATHDLTTLFLWDRLARGLVGALGTYVLLRQWAEHWTIRLLLPPLLVWSSFLLALFHQTAIIDQFVSAPWAAYFALRIVHSWDFRWRNWIGMAVFTGTAWQSYYFAGLWVLFLFLALGFLSFRRQDVKRVPAAPRVLMKAVVTAFLIVVMAFPNAVVFAKRAEWTFPARMLDHSYVGRRPLGGPLQYEPGMSITASSSIFMPFGVVQYTGTFSSPWDFLQMLAPAGNSHARGDEEKLTFGQPSEAFMYVGLLGYLGALWGLTMGAHPLKKVWLLTTLGFGLLMLGPSGGLLVLLRLYPPLWAVRHTHVFASFFVLGLLYFFVIGCNQLIREVPRDSRPVGPILPEGLVSGRWGGGVLACAAMLMVAAASFLHFTATPPPLPAVNWEAALLAGPLIVLLLARRRLQGVGLFLAVLIAHLGLVLWYAWTPSLLFHLVVFLTIPVLLLLLTGLTRFTSYRRWAFLVAAGILLVDLGLYVTRSDWLWHWPRPDDVLRISPLPARPDPPSPRVVVLPSAYLYGAYPQPIRYLSLALRRPTAFSSVMYSAEEPEEFFRSAPVAVAVSGWPQGAKAHTMSVGSELKLAVPIAPALRGQRVWIHLRAKSANTVPDGVQIEADFGTRRIVRSYRNSGGWERLTLDGPAHGNPVTVVARVRSSADASSVFERLSVRFTPIYGPLADFDLDLVGSGLRWNTFIAPARYVELVRRDLGAEALSEALALGESPVQFRTSPTDPVAGGARVVIRSYDYNSLRVAVDAPSPGYLYVADGFDSAWRALVDGRPSPVLPANMAFKAVRLTAGRHDIRLRYRPVQFQVALWMYFTVVGLGLSVLLIAGLRRRN